MNKVILIGNVGNDPEIKTLENGSKVANFSLATSEFYSKKSADGGEPEKVTLTTWHKIELWNGGASVAENHVKKGDRLSVDGKIMIQKFTDKEGIERTSIKIRAERIELLGKKRDEAESKAEQKASEKQGNKANEKQRSKSEKVDAEVVFQAPATVNEDLPF